MQRGVADAQRGPELGLSAGLSQQRQSEYGASTRMFDVIGGNRQALARFLSQPFTVAQVFTGREGKQVPVAETVRGFKEILEGKHDDVAENNFYMRGSIDEIKD